MENEMIQVVAAILSLDPLSEGVIVEAGSYQGGSTAKLSLAARIAHRKLVVFDSFEGLPEHQETHGKNIFGGDAYFPPGSYAGSLEKVSQNVTRFGAIEACEFKKGWFEDTLPRFDQPIGVAYVDVDLESSTKTCLKYLYPRLISGGTLFSQDGHLPWVIKILNDSGFWNKEVGFEKPAIPGLGKKKLLAIGKSQN
jgi:O-methyltransferase